MPKHLAYDVHKPHGTQRAYQFISHLMAYFKLQQVGGGRWMRIAPSITEAYFVKLFRGTEKKNPQTHKKITRSQHMLKNTLLLCLWVELIPSQLKLTQLEAVHLKGHFSFSLFYFDSSGQTIQYTSAVFFFSFKLLGLNNFQPLIKKNLLMETNGHICPLLI